MDDDQRLVAVDDHTVAEASEAWLALRLV